MEDLFPSNQLVTSPAQERAKMQLLKEQQLESMISAMDGVIGAKVSIAQKVDENGKPTGAPSAAVFIKYSPQFNLANYEVQIRSLIRDGVPDIASDQISVVMQAADYRYQAPAAEAPPSRWRQWLQAQPAQAAAAVAGGVLALCAMAGLSLWIARRKGECRCLMPPRPAHARSSACARRCSACTRWRGDRARSCTAGGGAISGSTRGGTTIAAIPAAAARSTR
ncbi:hypothetical protein OJJOAM_004222 [Cupriavidus sp. H18C1]|uniref:hypothetical protein n=1 Tax=Cupriavidus sp. H18C1 TaxID=3241601 RepID=UPI003BB8E3FF